MFLTVGAAVAQGVQLLESAGVGVPRLTAEVLLCHAIGCQRPWLHAHATDELKEVWWIHYGRYLHQRMQGVPTQYITGVQEFYGRDFRVTPGVLIPRPETEHLVEAALPLMGGRTLDIGTGSGAIAVTLALESGRTVIASEISAAALAVARANCVRLNAEVEFVQTDLASCFAAGQFDLVVSNPPYVPDAEPLTREVRDHEPALALFAGPQGLDVYRRLIPEAARVLRPGGWLMMELGHASAQGVRAMLRSWSNVEIRPDLAGIPRVVLAQSGLLP
jgi:release factor glutamine methyltransferase